MAHGKITTNWKAEGLVARRNADEKAAADEIKTWRLDPPDCDCKLLCKNPEHDRPEWVEVN